MYPKYKDAKPKTKKNENEPKIKKTSLSKKEIIDIRKDFNKSKYKFSKSKIKEIRINLYDIKNLKNPFKSSIKRIQKNLLELKESLSRHKKKSIMIMMILNTKE